MDRLEKRLCFFGPSPRTLFKDLRVYGPLADNPLEWWRGLVQEPEFDHELYAAHVSGGGWFPGEGAEEGLVVETLEELEAAKVIPCWPAPGEAAIQPAVNFVPPAMRSLLERPEALLLPHESQKIQIFWKPPMLKWRPTWSEGHLTTSTSLHSTWSEGNIFDKKNVVFEPESVKAWVAQRGAGVILIKEYCI